MLDAQSLLQEHADALAAAYPDDLDKLETRSARARHEEATEQLAAFGPDACAPPPPPVRPRLRSSRSRSPSPAPKTPVSAPDSPHRQTRPRGACRSPVA
jgi:hypothetical protein